MKISICIPVYNVEPRLLAQTIESALSQRDGFDLEVIVSDDLSSVDYRDILAAWPSSVVRFSRNEKNLGMVGNWNAAVKKSSGDLVLLLLQDDVVSDGMFEAYLREFREAPDVVLCSCAREFISEGGHPFRPRREVNDRSNIFVLMERYELSYHDAVRLCLRNGNAIGEPSAVMFRRWAFDRANGYDPLFEHAADVDFNLRIARYGTIVYLTHPYLNRRIRRGALTRTNFLAGSVGRDRTRLYERFHGTAQFTPDELASFRAYLVAKSAYDCWRLARALRLRALLAAFRNLMTYLDASPLLYLRYLREVASGRNRDRM